MQPGHSFALLLVPKTLMSSEVIMRLPGLSGGYQSEVGRTGKVKVKDVEKTEVEGTQYFS